MRAKLLTVGVCVWGASFAAAATVGLTQDFNGSFLWDGGSQSYTVEDGGVGGAGDNYLRVGNPDFAQQLGVRTSDPEFIGDYTAAGVTAMTVWLKDVGTDDALEIHLGVGTSFSNFWFYRPALIPTESDWTEFTIDFTNPADWVRVQGSGTFEDALANVDRIVFRHDLEPIEFFPDIIQADFGIDRVTLVPEPAGLVLLLGAGLLATRRRPG